MLITNLDELIMTISTTKVSSSPELEASFTVSDTFSSSS